MILGAGPIIIGACGRKLGSLPPVAAVSLSRRGRRRAWPRETTLCFQLWQHFPTFCSAACVFLGLPAGQACEFDYSGTQACKALK